MAFISFDYKIDHKEICNSEIIYDLLVALVATTISIQKLVSYNVIILIKL